MAAGDRLSKPKEATLRWSGRLNNSTSLHPGSFPGATAGRATVAVWRRKRARSQRALSPNRGGLAVMGRAPAAGQISGKPFPPAHGRGCVADGQDRGANQRPRCFSRAGARRGRHGARSPWARRGAEGPQRPRKNAGAEGRQPREAGGSFPLTELVQMARRDVRVRASLASETVHVQPTQDAASRRLPRRGRGRRQPGSPREDPQPTFRSSCPPRPHRRPGTRDRRFSRRGRMREHPSGWRHPRKWKRRPVPAVDPRPGAREGPVRGHDHCGAQRRPRGARASSPEPQGTGRGTATLRSPGGRIARRPSVFWAREQNRGCGHARSRAVEPPPLGKSGRGVASGGTWCPHEGAPASREPGCRASALQLCRRETSPACPLTRVAAATPRPWAGWKLEAPVPDPTDRTRVPVLSRTSQWSILRIPPGLHSR